MSENLSKVLCSTHTDEECTFVCGICEEMICDDCIDEDHSGHEVKSIKKFIKEVDLGELKAACSNVGLFQIKSQVTEKCEEAFQKAVDAISLRSANMISEIEKIREKKIEECKATKKENKNKVENIISLVDPSEISEKIASLPSSASRTQYAEVTQAYLNYMKKIEAQDFEAKTEQDIFIPNLKKGKIQKARLEKMFGMLEMEEMSIDDLLSDDDDDDSDDETSDDDSNNYENNPKSDDDGEGLNDFAED